MKTSKVGKAYVKLALRENCPNTEFFLVRISHIRTEYGEILRISPYSVRMWENTDQEIRRIWTLFTQCGHGYNSLKLITSIEKLLMV